MIFNHRRETVWQHAGGKSLCPLCSSPLLARRGEILVWHWAHRPFRGARRWCPWEESEWHLQWKYAYLHFAGWQIEMPVIVNGRKFVLDAVNPTTGQVREFVHSLSDYYVAKHRALRRSRYMVTWLFDGDVAGSLRTKKTADGDGLRRLLKPRAWALHEQIGGLAHWGGGLWKHWQNNVWYPRTGERAQAVLNAFDSAGSWMGD